MRVGLLFVCVVTLNGVQAQDGSSLAEQYRLPPSQWPPFVVDDGVQAEEIGPLPPLPPVSWHTPAAEQLGKLLFFDPRLSGSGQLACVSCHDVQLGWADGRRVAAGHDRFAGSRNAMTLLNAAYFDHLFWDGRAQGLLELALQPIQSPAEMNAEIPAIILRLKETDGYPDAFGEAFGSPEITAQRIAEALASYVRSISWSSSRFDRFVRGDYERLTGQEIEGLHLFRTRARCMNCHNGPRFSDGSFHHTGLSYYGRRFEDLGRSEVTGKSEDRGKFRTPTLRNVRNTGPWMHNGLFTDFTGILRMYNHGITFSARPRPGAPELSPLVRPLGLDSSELAALEAFLDTLSRRPSFVEPPELPGFDASANRLQTESQSSALR